MFNNLATSVTFFDAKIFLFLNKLDLFGDLCQRLSIRHSFPEYKGRDELGEAVDFIKRQFLKGTDDEHVE